MSLIGPRPDLPEALHMYSDVDRRKLEVVRGLRDIIKRSLGIPSLPKRSSEMMYYVSNLFLFC